MRISDWSSDVCSSDLTVGGELAAGTERVAIAALAATAGDGAALAASANTCAIKRAGEPNVSNKARRGIEIDHFLSSAATASVSARESTPISRKPRSEAQSATRSDEHTSELQSLMRNSYAVFCLQKTTTK